MNKPFDATLNSLIDDHLEEWASFLAVRAGLPMGPVVAIDTDLSANLQADRLFRIDGPSPLLVHLELESSGRLGIPGELLRYNVAAHGATNLPVASIVLLLRPKATATDLTGVHELYTADTPYLTFRYSVIRLWQESMDTFLKAGLGLVPLALLTNEAYDDLPSALDRFDARLQEPDVTDILKKKIHGASYVLSGLRYSGERLLEYFMSIERVLQDSSTYQWMIQRAEARGLAQGVAQGVAQGEAVGEARGLAQGEARGLAQGVAQGVADEARKIVLRLATKRFGSPPTQADVVLQLIADRDHLERIAERILDANGWDDLMATE